MTNTPSKLTHAQKLGLVMGGDVDKAYFEALGRFLAEFAELEELLYLFLISELGLHTKTAACILSGVRAAEAIAAIKRLFEQKGKELPANIAEAFQHIATLTTARNEIIHFGGRGRGRFERTVSTALKAHVEKKAREWVVSADTLLDMFLDTEKALNTILVPLIPNMVPPPDATASLARSWQFKYPADPRPQSKGNASS